MNYHRSATIRESRLSGDLVIHNVPKDNVSATRALRITRSRPEYWPDGVALSNWPVYQLYAVDVKESFQNLADIALLLGIDVPVPPKVTLESVILLAKVLDSRGALNIEDRRTSVPGYYALENKRHVDRFHKNMEGGI